MDLNLDRHDLEDRAVWQAKRFDETLVNTIRVLERAIVDLQALRKRTPQGQEPGKFSADNPGHLAQEAINIVTGALYNAQLPQLAHSAADLEVTLQAHGALVRLKAAQTAMVQRSLEAQEDDRLARRQDQARLAEDRRAASRRTQCEAEAQQGDSRVTIWGQCSRKGTTTREIGRTVIRVCTQHAKHRDTRIYVSRDRTLNLSPKA